MTTQKQREATRRIEQILRERGSPLADEIGSAEYVKYLPRLIREKIVHELTDEFTGKGLKLDSEPNTYGLEIEDLIDECGLAWDK